MIPLLISDWLEDCSGRNPGWQVQYAHDGAEALEQIRQQATRHRSDRSSNAQREWFAAGIGCEIRVSPRTNHLDDRGGQRGNCRSSPTTGSRQLRPPNDALPKTLSTQ